MPNFNQALKLLKSKDFEKARDLLEDLLNETPDDVNLLYNLGMCYSEMNHPAKAIELLTRCVQLAWTNKETNETLKTFSIITTQANPLLAEIHNTKRRMPVILRPQDERRWLSDIPLDEAIGLLAPYDEKAMVGGGWRPTRYRS